LWFNNARVVNIQKGSDEMAKEKKADQAEAKMLGDQLHVDWNKVDIEEFRMGLIVELEHGLRDPATNVTGDDKIMTAKIALAHLNEYPDYYTRLAKLEKEADDFWSQKGR
jgi:hypothetical protein